MLLLHKHVTTNRLLQRNSPNKTIDVEIIIQVLRNLALTIEVNKIKDFKSALKTLQ